MNCQMIAISDGQTIREQVIQIIYLLGEKKNSIGDLK